MLMIATATVALSFRAKVFSGEAFWLGWKQSPQPEDPKSETLALT